MCNLYRLTTTTEAIRALFACEEGPWPNLPALADIYPGRTAPIIVPTPTGRALAAATWGLPPPPSARGPVTNVRNLKSPFWRPLLDQRCLVPASAFCEWSAAADPATGRKQPHWFGLRSSPLFAFAGLFRVVEGTTRFAFLTCPPNATVAAVHPKAMPVLLTGARADAWLARGPAEAFQQPVADAEMIVEPRPTEEARAEGPAA